MPVEPQSPINPESATQAQMQAGLPEADACTADTAPADNEPAVTDWPASMLVIVPVYNHARQVGDVVKGVLALGAPLLVIDDGSTDDSAAVARAAGAEVISLPTNCGKATALQRGMQEAEERGFRQILSCDADGQHPASEVKVLAQAGRNRLDCFFIGQRRMSPGETPFISRLGRFLSNCSCKVLCGNWPGDSQSGLRIYPIPAVNRLEVPARRYAFEIEVLIRGAWAGLPLEAIEVEVLYPEDRVSHFNKLRDNFHATSVILRLLGRRLLPVPHKRLDGLCDEPGQTSSS